MDDRDIIDRLEKLDTCAVSDALDALGLRGTVPGLMRRSTRKRIAGRVLTVKLHAHEPEGGSKRHLGTAAIEAADAGTVIVVEQRTGVDAAGWGGVLSNAAQMRGVRGVILEGPARDIDECEDIGFPIFSRSATAHTARGRVYEQSYGTPIRVADVEVSAGDYVIADGSAVVFVAKAHVGDVLATAERIAEKERRMTVDVRAGKSVSDVMGTDYESMLHREDR